MTFDHILISRLYDPSCSDDRTRYFSRISTSLDLRSVEKLYPPFSEKKIPHVCANICNGLLCLLYPNGTYCLWNPSTGDLKTLPPLKHPPCPLPRISHTNGCAGSAMEFPAPYSCALGFDYKAQDYKFLKFIILKYDDADGEFHTSAVQISLYSLKNDSWKDISDHKEYHIRDAHATYLNGRFYWRARKYIISFDLVDEKFSRLPFPDVAQLETNNNYVLNLMEFDGVAQLETNNNYVLNLMEFDGSLGVVAYPRLGVEKLFAFWVLEKDGSCSWTRKLNYDVCTSDVEKPLGLCRNGELLLLEGFDGKLVVYDYSVGELKKIDELYDYPHIKKVFPYVESTVTFKTKKKRRRDNRSRRRKKKGTDGYV